MVCLEVRSLETHPHSFGQSNHLSSQAWVLQSYCGQVEWIAFQSSRGILKKTVVSSRWAIVLEYFSGVLGGEDAAFLLPSAH
jgi:hypothetical protein